MKVTFELENDEVGLPIEYATGIIKAFIYSDDGTYPTDAELFDYQKRTLQEITEHIQVYLQNARW